MATTLLVTACGGADPTGPSWIDAARRTAPPIDSDAGAPTDPVDSSAGCAIAAEPDAPPAVPGPTAPSGPTGGEITRGTGNDPFTATGARQVPGPGMHRASPPPEPVNRVVAAPVDPDEHVAARQPDGADTGPIPPPKVIGADASTPPIVVPGEAQPMAVCPGAGL